MDPVSEFKKEVSANITRLGSDDVLKKMSLDWMIAAGTKGNYTYNFTWMGRPIIQFPQDMVAMQELIWQIKPDLIIETGIAHGGSLIFSASMLALLDYEEAISNAIKIDPLNSKRKVLGIDIDIRSHNKSEIQAHPLSNMIQMIQGSSINDAVVDKVRTIAQDFQKVLVCLDSNHTYEHVLAELNAYAPLVSTNSYCVVFDTIVEMMPDEIIIDRPWEPGNSPKTAVDKFLKDNSGFEIDKSIDNKLLISVAPDGYLKKVSDETAN